MSYNLLSHVIAPDDYLIEKSQEEVVFMDGQMAGSLACAQIQVVDDNVIEPDEETVSVSISSKSPTVTVITVASATLIIKENDNDG